MCIRDRPKLYRSHKFAQAILELESAQRGEIDPEQYRREVGWRADVSIFPEFHPHVLFWGGHEPFGANHVDCACESANFQIPAMEKFDFIVNMHNRFTPTVKMADLILPAMDCMWEERQVTKSYYGGCESINYCPGVSKAPGERCV